MPVLVITVHVFVFIVVASLDELPGPSAFFAEGLLKQRVTENEFVGTLGTSPFRGAESIKPLLLRVGHTPNNMSLI